MDARDGAFNVMRFVRWIERQSDPVLEDGESVILRGAGEFAPAGSSLISGILVLTNRRLRFKPGKTKLFQVVPKPTEIPVTVIKAMRRTGRRSIGDPFPRVERISLTTTDGVEYMLQTFGWDVWEPAVLALLDRDSASGRPALSSEGD